MMDCLPKPTPAKSAQAPTYPGNPGPRQPKRVRISEKGHNIQKVAAIGNRKAKATAAKEANYTQGDNNSEGQDCEVFGNLYCRCLGSKLELNA